MSAPLSSNSFIVSIEFPCEASCKGVQKFSLEALIFAPAFSNRRIISKSPLRTAICKGVKPEWLEQFTFAPCANRLFAIAS